MVEEFIKLADNHQCKEVHDDFSLVFIGQKPDESNSLDEDHYRELH